MMMILCDTDSDASMTLSSWSAISLLAGRELMKTCHLSRRPNHISYISSYYDVGVP